MGALTPELMEDVTSQSLILNILAFANSPQRHGDTEDAQRLNQLTIARKDPCKFVSVPLSSLW